LHTGRCEGQGRAALPSVGLIDSQSVKTTRVGGEARGVDSGKKVKGRKKHIITDTGGLLLSVEIHAASEHDGKAGLRLIESLNCHFGRMKKIYVDGGYRRELVEYVRSIKNYAFLTSQSYIFNQINFAV
jgi:hypothetical protein